MHARIRVTFRIGTKFSRTLFVPEAIGSETTLGKDNAVALSPDGHRLAAGGWDAYPNRAYRQMIDDVYRLLDEIRKAA